MARDLKLEVRLQALDRASKPFKEASRGAVGLARTLKDTRSELKGLQTLQRDVSGFRALKTESDRTGAALQASRDKVRQLSQQIAAAGAPTKALNTRFRTAVREATALKNKHAEQQRELQGLRGKLDGAGISTRNLATHERELRTRVTAANASIAEQENRLKRLTAQQQRHARAKASFDHSQQVAGSMAANGAAGLASGSGILYTGARLIAPGVQFDADMSKVQALTRLDANSEELAALRAQARQLGAATQFTATDAAQGQGFLAMAGFNPKAIQAAMPGMLDLAKAGDSGLAETADIASNILTGFNLQAGETGRLGDVLVGTFTRSNTNLQMLGETMKYVAPVASSVGQDIETMAAMAGKLGDAGIQGSMGGTALRSILGRLSAPPKAAAEALQTLGVSAKDAKGNLRDLPTVLQEIYKKTANMGDADRAGLLKDIAGEEAVAGMQVLVKQAGTGELQKFIGTLRQTQGEASRTAKVMGDNLVGDIDQLSSAWQDLGIQIQEQQNGPLRGLVQGVSRIVGGIKTWIAANPELAGQIFKTAAGLGALMAGMGGVTLAMASVLGPFAMVRFGLNLLGLKSFSVIGTLWRLGSVALPMVGKALLLVGRAAMLNPIGLLITAIAGAAYLIYRNWDSIGPWFADRWQDIRNAFGGGLAGIVGLLMNWSPIGLFYKGFAAVMSYFGVELPGKFTEFGGMILQGLVTGITNGLGMVRDAVTGAGSAAIGWFKETLGIHSPSREFAELGGFTMAGLTEGLQDGEKGPLATVTGMAKNLLAAGAVSLGLGASTAMAEPVPLDTRAPLGAGTAAATASPVANNTYNITINAPAGANAQEIARMVAAEIDRRQAASQARSRSSLYDQD